MARDRSLTPPRRHGESQKLTQDRGDRYDRRSSKYDPHDEDHDSSTRKRRRSRTRSRNRDGDPPSLKDGEHTGSRSRGGDDGRKSIKYVFASAPDCDTKLHTRRRKRDKSEERRARKAEKKRIREEEEARQVAELSVYSATDNPFHDVNLGQQFRWHKKSEKEKKQGLSLAEIQRRDVLRRQEAKEELERLNRRRAEREAEQRLREEEEVRMQRLAESAQMAEWIAKDGDFQLDQERQRAAIRIKEKRAKAIDFLALNLRYVNPIDEGNDESGIDDTGLEIDLDEPYNIFDVSLPRLCSNLLFN